MSDAQRPKRIELVVKISKYCNLRCAYCYEFEELGDRRRMALDDIARLFRAVRDHALETGLIEAEFVWHGGEPLLIPLDYYAAIRDLQKDIFKDALRATNSTQTNLTVLTDRHVEFLKNGGFFDSLGVSFDVFGDQRVDVRGKLRTEQVLANMQTLMAEGIAFGAITVLARNTYEKARDIYRFWDRLKIPSRFLPFHLSASAIQADRHALLNREIVAALSGIFDAWLASETASPVDPLGAYLPHAVASLAEAPLQPTYDKALQETVFIVNVDGGVWGAGVGEIYDSDYAYGNIFHEDFAALLASPGRRRAIAEGEARMAAHCAACPYFGHCPGDYVADVSKEEIAALEREGCHVRALLDHMTKRLREADLLDVLQEGCAPRLEVAAP